MQRLRQILVRPLQAAPGTGYPFLGSPILCNIVFAWASLLVQPHLTVHCWTEPRTQNMESSRTFSHKTAQNMGPPRCPLPCHAKCSSTFLSSLFRTHSESCIVLSILLAFRSCSCLCKNKREVRGDMGEDEQVQTQWGGPRGDCGSVWN